MSEAKEKYLEWLDSWIPVSEVGNYIEELEKEHTEMLTAIIDVLKFTCDFKATEMDHVWNKLYELPEKITGKPLEEILNERT